MLMPKKTKYRKYQRGRNRGKASSGNQINFGDYVLAAENPEIGFSNLSGIDSLAFNVIYGLDAFIDTVEVINGQISLGIEFNSFEIRNLNLDYIAAITNNMQLPVTESPDIEGIPQGFTDIEFMDMIIEIELINEIGLYLLVI